MKIRKILSVFISMIMLNSLFVYTCIGEETKQTPYMKGSPIAIGQGHCMAVDKFGDLYTWGRNDYGQLGNGETANSPIPTCVLRNVKEVAAGISHSVALKNDGSLWVWGSYKVKNSEKSPKQPIKIADNVISIAANGYYTLAIKDDGSLWGWGYLNSSGPSGITFEETKPIYQSSSLYKVIDIAAAKDCYAYIVEFGGFVEKLEKAKDIKKIYPHEANLTAYVHGYVYGSLLNNSMIPHKVSGNDEYDTYIVEAYSDLLVGIDSKKGNYQNLPLDRIWGVGSGYFYDNIHGNVSSPPNSIETTFFTGYDSDRLRARTGFLKHNGLSVAGILGNYYNFRKLVGDPLIDPMGRYGEITSDNLGRLIIDGGNNFTAGYHDTYVIIDGQIYDEGTNKLHNVSNVEKTTYMAVLPDGGLYVWGDNCYGQLGSYEDENRSSLRINTINNSQGDLSLTNTSGAGLNLRIHEEMSLQRNNIDKGVLALSSEVETVTVNSNPVKMLDNMEVPAPTAPVTPIPSTPTPTTIPNTPTTPPKSPSSGGGGGGGGGSVTQSTTKPSSTPMTKPTGKPTATPTTKPTNTPVVVTPNPYTSTPPSWNDTPDNPPATDFEKVITFTIGSSTFTSNSFEKQVEAGGGVAPIIVNGRTLIPIRTLAEELNYTVGWEANTKEIILTWLNKTVKMQIGSTVATVTDSDTGETTYHTFDVPASIINERTMVPVRFISELFGCTVDYDANNKTVTITRQYIM